MCSEKSSDETTELLTKVSTQSRVVLPPKVREKLDVKTGDHVGFFFIGNDIIIKKIVFSPASVSIG